MYFGDRGVFLVLGISQDKNLEGMVEELAQISRHVIVTRSRHPRAAPAETVADIFRAQGVTVAQIEEVDRAMVRALEEAGERHMVLATGSLFVAAEVREFIKGIEPELYPELHGDPYPVSR
jgi:dihydrofolate synthase/folylpolyglutamate synthase